MPQAIWKFPFPVIDGIDILMPAGAKILTVQVQFGVPTMWATCDVGAEPVTRRFRIFGTGHQHEKIEGDYIGTFQLDGGALIFHVFEIKLPEGNGDG